MKGFVGRNIDIDATAEALSGTAQLVRSGVVIRNLSTTGTIYIGLDNTVTSSTGFPIDPGKTERFDAGFIPTNSLGQHDLALLFAIGSEANIAAAWWGI